MLAARIGLAGAMERIDEDEPLVDVVLALSASTAGMLVLLDVVAGRWPLTAVPCLSILAAHAFRLRRVGIVAAGLVWLRTLGLSEASGIVTPILMLTTCAAMLIGPGRVLDWLEVRWEAAAEGHRLRRRRAALASPPNDEEPGPVGWIEDLPDGR